MRARYNLSDRKAVEVILWLAWRKRGIDFHNLLKVLFYADKYHINAYGRPIVGGDYAADRWGPVCRQVYYILAGDPWYLQAVERNGKLPFRVVSRYHVEADRDANPRLLSESDVEALRFALEQYGHLSFDELTALSHQEEAYRRADGGRMRYEDFLEETPDRDERAADLAEVSRHVAL
jgi:uncharacterized phage-associated protein